MNRLELKQTIENFMTDKDRDERELFVAIRVNGDIIADFHINEDGRCIDENSIQKELMISNIYSDEIGLAPDIVHIDYESVKDCIIGTHPGEIEGEVIADLMTLIYENGTELELGFLRI